MTTPDYPWIQNYPKDVRWDLPIPEGSMVDVFDQTTKDYKDRPAFDFLDKKMTWGDMAQMVERFAYGLQSIGVEKGTKVGLFLPNSPYFVAAYYGALKLGAVVVNYNPLYATSELAHQIEDSETDMMITLDLTMLFDKAQQMLVDTRLKNLVICKFTDILPFPKNILFPIFKSSEKAKVKSDARITWFHNFTAPKTPFKNVTVDPLNDLAVLQYTGGTTGVPKGAMLTHQNIYANATQSLRWFTESEMGTQKMLGVLPFFHVFAMTAIMNMGIMSAMEIIALPRFDLEDALKIIDKKKPHFFPAVPAIYNAINNHEHLDRYDLSSVKYCISGGAPLPVEVKKKFESITDCTVVEGYGLSESSPVACVNPLNGENIAGSIGLPVPNTIIEIIDPEDKTTHMPIGERGELCIRGPQVMKGYYNNEAATKDVLQNGRLYTGDVAIMDEHGYIYIVDRIKDMIITNGYKVYPRNVEEAIYKHPSVEECIVAGLPHDQRGEIVKTWIKLKDDRELSEADLKEFLADKISKMEIPKQIEFRIDPLPKTMIGKLSRKDVVAQEQS